MNKIKRYVKFLHFSSSVLPVIPDAVHKQDKKIYHPGPLIIQGIKDLNGP